MKYKPKQTKDGLIINGTFQPRKPTQKEEQAMWEIINKLKKHIEIRTF